jgi:predicted N-acetyltransferase YhbS
MHFILEDSSEVRSVRRVNDESVHSVFTEGGECSQREASVHKATTGGGHNKTVSEVYRSDPQIIIC